jgi:hypothetical protein
MSTIEELRRDCAYCRQPIELKWKNGPMPSEGVCLVVDQVFHDRCWGEVLGRSERSHEALEPHRSLKDARLVAAAKAAPTPVMSNSTGRASASRLALACYCCDRVLAAEARFHDPPLPGLLVADQLRRPPRSFVPVSAHGQGSLRYLPPSKRQSAPAPAKLAVLDCRAEGTCGHERSFGLRRGRGARSADC